MTFRDLESIILADGWQYKNTVGSHNHYVHPSKPGKVTIPRRVGDISKGVVNAVYKQAGLK